MAYALTPGASSGRRALLLVVGIASFVLCFDDQFMIHELLLQWGAAELWLTGPYAAAAAWVAARHRHDIFDHPDAVVLLLGAGFLALSLVIDVLHLEFKGSPTAEETAKFAGIAFWCLFAVRAGMRLIRETSFSATAERLE